MFFLQEKHLKNASKTRIKVFTSKSFYQHYFPLICAEFCALTRVVHTTTVCEVHKHVLLSRKHSLRPAKPDMLAAALSLKNAINAYVAPGLGIRFPSNRVIK